MSIVIQNIQYIHPDKEELFRDLCFSISKGEKAGLIGNNGSGKSTLLKVMAGVLKASAGEIITPTPPYYVPQHFGQYDHLTVGEALQVAEKIRALQAILAGDASPENFNTLDDDWEIEEKCLAALAGWDLEHIPLQHPLSSLSGGEKTKVFLAGISLHQPSVILMDEPTNHLDASSRSKLYRLIHSSHATILIVSHDITLLNLLSRIYEIENKKILIYGGNYDFYKIRKEEQMNALQTALEDREKALRQARKTAREVAERQQKLDARGKQLSLKKGISRMQMNTLRDKAEKSTTKLTENHTNKMDEIRDSIKQLQNQIPDLQQLKIRLNSPSLHTGKTLVSGKDLEFGYGEGSLWKKPLSLTVKSGDHLLIKGNNGSGKSTLLKLLMGDLTPGKGEIRRADFSYISLDQEYSIIENELTLCEQLQQFNTNHLEEHELKSLLNRFLFPYNTWDKKGHQLSGGEKLRLLFCCLLVSNQTPDVILLDEPTNNLDIQSSEIILAALKEYKGTIIAISHDLHFIDQIGFSQVLQL